MASLELRGWLVYAIVAGIVISAIYGLRAIARVFFGDESDEFKESQKEVAVVDMNWSERVPALLLIVVLFFIGFFPKTVTKSLNDALNSEPVYAQAEDNK